jgi:hypothetical protein
MLRAIQPWRGRSRGCRGRRIGARRRAESVEAPELDARRASFPSAPPASPTACESPTLPCGTSPNGPRRNGACGARARTQAAISPNPRHPPMRPAWGRHARSFAPASRARHAAPSRHVVAAETEQERTSRTKKGAYTKVLLRTEERTRPDEVDASSGSISFRSRCRQNDALVLENVAPRRAFGTLRSADRKVLHDRS